MLKMRMKIVLGAKYKIATLNTGGRKETRGKG